MPINLTNQQAVSPQAIHRLRAIKREEGFRPKPFLDTEGNLTVGSGFNISDPSVARFIPQDVVSGERPLPESESDNLLLTRFIPIAVSDAKKFFGEDVFNSLSNSQRQALIDMSLNLGGPKLSTFKKLKAALTQGDFMKAAREILDSKYALQVPERAKRNAALILMTKDLMETSNDQSR